MKNSIILLMLFIAIVTFAFSGLHERDLLGGTQLNGAGCVCHTLERDTTVSVWIEGPDTLVKGQTGLYKMYLANGPAEAGGQNVAGRFGIMSLVDTLSVWDSLSPNELTQAFPLPFPSPQDTIYWEFAYTAPDSVVTDTLYSCGLSIVYDHIPDFHDRWNFGPKFPVEIIEGLVPVELTGFSAITGDGNIILKWQTSTEINNSGFEIQRIKDASIEKSGQWESIGFVNGNGTTTETNSYTFKDENLCAGKYQYRLKQIDFDGSFNFSKIIEVESENISTFTLLQNYPNPFNPSTKIQYKISQQEFVLLTVYNSVGEKVVQLVNRIQPAGMYNVEFNADAKLSSGIYFYELKTGDNILTKKMLLLK